MVGKEHPCLRKSFSIAEREKKKQIHVHCSVKIFSQIKRNKMQSYLSPLLFDSNLVPLMTLWPPTWSMSTMVFLLHKGWHLAKASVDALQLGGAQFGPIQELNQRMGGGGGDTVGHNK
jgi:hypothetical protein